LIDFNIYLIGDKNIFGDEKDYLEALDKCFDSGIGAFQLRQKDISVKEFFKLGEKIRVILKKYPDIKLFVNDRVDVALALGAYGVHLNKNSVPISVVKERIKGIKIFYSSHSSEEAKKAEEAGADFVTFSPIFKTKNNGFEQGTDVFKKVLKLLRIPVFALGGINENNLSEIKGVGGCYVAVQSGILRNRDIGSAVRSFAGISTLNDIN